jgi:hypothetical protein
MGLDRYWQTDRWHSHTVVFTLGDEQHPEAVDCPPEPWCFLCRSTNETRVGVAFVSAVGAASGARLSWWERLHRAFMFSRFARP